MSPGVATPCPAAPPIPIAKVCFIAPSLTECRPFHCSPALGRAQIKVCNSVIETLPPNDQLAFPVSRSIHPILPYVLATQRFSTVHGGRPRPNRSDSSIELGSRQGSAVRRPLESVAVRAALASAMV